MGLMAFVQSAKQKIREYQYGQALKKEGEREMDKNRLKRMAEEEKHYKRLQRIERKKANISRLKSNLSPLKRIGGRLQKDEVQKLKSDSPFTLGSSSVETPFNLGSKKDNPFIK